MPYVKLLGWLPTLASRRSTKRSMRSSPAWVCFRSVPDRGNACQLMPVAIIPLVLKNVPALSEDVYFPQPEQAAANRKDSKC
jgi:hypothetical protein